ncbi:hypothetical protein CY35_13G126700 [Sphagnum magellanicum]|nr:hypothetical protein CY35_13G126700 [Sphagnum magellanicum]
MIGSPTSNRLNRFGINGQGVREELFFNNDDLNWPLDAEAIWRWESDAADSGLMHEPPSQGTDSILSFACEAVNILSIRIQQFQRSRISAYNSEVRHADNICASAVHAWLRP